MTLKLCWDIGHTHTHPIPQTYMIICHILSNKLFDTYQTFDNMKVYYALIISNSHQTSYLV